MFYIPFREWSFRSDGNFVLSNFDSHLFQVVQFSFNLDFAHQEGFLKKEIHGIAMKLLREVGPKVKKFKSKFLKLHEHILKLKTCHDLGNCNRTIIIHLAVLNYLQGHQFSWFHLQQEGHSQCWKSRLTFSLKLSSLSNVKKEKKSIHAADEHKNVNRVIIIFLQILKSIYMTLIKHELQEIGEIYFSCTTGFSEIQKSFVALFH